MKLGHIEVFVSDPIASKAFYEGVLGFEVVAVQDAHFVWLKSGGVEILLRRGQPPRTEVYQQTGMALVLYADDLTAVAEKLTARGLSFKGTDGSDGCLTFTDPDGNWFQLTDPNAH